MVGLDKIDVLPPLMIVHGMVDDNVVVAHTLRLSSALLEAGKPHSVLPLTGVTHMTPQEVVAENLLLLQVEFLRDALGIGRTRRAWVAARGATRKRSSRCTAPRRVPRFSRPAAFWERAAPEKAV